MLRDELVGAPDVTIEERDAKTVSRCIAGKIGTHGREAENAKISERGHEALSCFAGTGSLGVRRRSIQFT